MKATQLYNTGQTILITVALSLFSLSSQAQIFFYDGFESGDFSAPGYPNSNFNWGSGGASNRHIASMTTQGDPVIVHTNAPDGTVLTGDPRDWTARTGDNCFLVRYPAGTHWMEQRFNMSDPPGVSDLWMSWEMRVPTNYFHNSQVSASKENNKLLRVYMGGEGGTTIGLSYRPTSAEDGSSYYFLKIFNSGNPLESGADKEIAPFISVPEHLGKWMKIVLHVKASSAIGANDGVFEVWKKWEDETEFTKDMDLQNRGIDPSTNTNPTITGFVDGYLMGYANSAFSAETEWLIDNFTLSTTSLIDSTTTEIQETTEVSIIKVYPNPASNHVTISGLSLEGQTSVILSNTLGQQVGETMNFTGKTSAQMNTEHFPKGVYLLTVVTNNQESVHKIIKN